jgi:hypothetical protein
VHRLIGDQLLQHRRRRLPIDPPQLEKAAVEPRGEQMLQVGIEQLQFRLVAQMRGDLAAHRDQCAGATGRHVHPPQQFLPGRIGGLRERGRRLRRAVGEVVFRRGAQRRFVGLKFRGEIAVKAVLIAGIESAQLVQLARLMRS